MTDPHPGLLLVGESNPYSRDPDDALFHLPRGAAGDRLRAVLGLTDVEYLRVFPNGQRRNLLPPMGTSKLPQAKLLELARKLLNEKDPRVVVAVGKTATKGLALALGLRQIGLEPASFCSEVGEWGRPGENPHAVTLVSLPHTSGRNRMWNDDLNHARARLCVATALETAVRAPMRELEDDLAAGRVSQGYTRAATSRDNSDLLEIARKLVAVSDPFSGTRPRSQGSTSARSTAAPTTSTTRRSSRGREIRGAVLPKGSYWPADQKPKLPTSRRNDPFFAIPRRTDIPLPKNR